MFHQKYCGAVSAITPWLLFVRVIGCGDREVKKWDVKREKEMGEKHDQSKRVGHHDDISMGNFQTRFSTVHNEQFVLVPPKETLMQVLVRLVGIRNSNDQ